MVITSVIVVILVFISDIFLAVTSTLICTNRQLVGKQHLGFYVMENTLSKSSELTVLDSGFGSLPFRPGSIRKSDLGFRIGLSIVLHTWGAGWATPLV